MAITQIISIFACRELKPSSGSTSRYIYFPRAVWRCIRNYGRDRSDIGAGCPEQFEWSFFRDWVWTCPTRSRAQHTALLANLPSGIGGIILRSPAQVEKFTSDLPRSLDGGGRG